MQAPQHVIALSHCRLSMIQMTRARRELLFSGASYQADLTTTSLHPQQTGRFLTTSSHRTPSQF